MSNIVRKKDWDDGLAEAVATGAAIGGVAGAINAARDIQTTDKSKKMSDKTLNSDESAWKEVK